MAVDSYIFNAQAGETPETVARRRQVADALAARIFGRAPQNVGEGIASIGQALIARSMANDADAAQKAGLAAGNAAYASLLPGVGTPTAPPLATPAPAAAAPNNGAVVPNDSNAMPGTVGMNMALADRSQDFIQDNPGTSMSSGVRSTADQARLYANRANNPNPVAVPGTSHHETGNAIDIAGMTPEQRAMLPQYGLAQPYANDAPHVELAPTQQPYQVAGPAVAAPQSPIPAAPQASAAPTAALAASGPSMAQLAQAASNPWLNSGQRSVVNALLQQKIQQSDPLRQLQIQKAQRDLDKSDWEWKPYGRDANGNWSYAWTNSKTREIRDQNGQPIKQNAAPVDDPTAGLTGEDYLNAIPKDRADIARKVAAGEIDVASLPNRGNYRMQVLSDAARYDPTFNPIDYKTRLATRKDFTSGKSAQNITSFNTAIGHLDSLDKSIDALGNRGSSWYNMATAPISLQTDPHYQAALKDFRTSKQAVADELARAFKGAGGTVHDISEWEKTINEADSPVALHAATRRAVELLRSRIEAVGDQYNRGMGKKTDPVSLLSPKAQATLARLEGAGTEANAPAGVDPAALAEARRRGLIK